MGTEDHREESRTTMSRPDYENEAARESVASGGPRSLDWAT